MEARSGIRTSEFWLALCVTTLAAVATVYAEAEWAKAAAIIAAALTSAGYGFSRATAKKEGPLTVNNNGTPIK